MTADSRAVNCCCALLKIQEHQMSRYGAYLSHNGWRYINGNKELGFRVKFGLGFRYRHGDSGAC
jgi:hypothetical protein